MKEVTHVSSSLRIDGSTFEKLVTALETLIEAEPKITHYDTVVGDGDCGETLAQGANAILTALKRTRSLKKA